MSSEEQVIAQELGTALLREHITQSRFESQTIAQYDGRKRKRRAENVESPVAESSVASGPTTKSSIASTITIRDKTFSVPADIWSALYEFQRIGVRFLLEKYAADSGALLADEMGLGKSVQVIAFLSALRGVDPVLLVCPTTLVSNWEREFLKWGRLVVDVDFFLGDAKGSVQKKLPPTPFVFIVSYEVLRARIDRVAAHRFSVLVLDEAQRIRNPFAQTTQAAKRVDARCRVALSGSPIQNNLSELWSVFDFVAPGKLGSLGAFREELGDPIEQGTRPRADVGAVRRAVKCAIILRELTAPLMLRRLKTDYADQLGLAPKDEQVLFCQLAPEQVQIYCQFLSTKSVRDVVSRKPNLGKTFYCLSILRKIANHPDLLLDTQVDDFGAISRSGKLQVLVPLLRVWHREKRRCLIFSQSLGMLDILEGVFRRELGFGYARMDGATSMAERDRIVKGFGSLDEEEEEFGANSPFALLLSTRVGGVGLNLIAAERVVIFDPDWNPMTDAQARERSWRIGQEKAVKIFRLVAADSVEEVICRRQIYKHHLAQKILVDPRQAKTNQWDHVEDFFKMPKMSASNGISSTGKKILQRLIASDAQEAPERNLPTPDEDTEPLADLITKVWNQQEIEMPALMGEFDTAEQIDHNARRAVQAVLAESTKDNVVVYSEPKKKTGGSALSRSQGLLGDLTRAQPVVRFESTEHVIEKTFVKDLRAFFKKNAEKTTQEVLAHFEKKIPSGGNEIFRACLRALCDYTDGYWTLKSEHR